MPANQRLHRPRDAPVRRETVGRTGEDELMHHDLDRLLEGAESARTWSGGDFDDIRRWSYGDVENNGVYYHPNLTHYAHQVFEEVFLLQKGLHYTDLSGREQRHREARQRHTPPIGARMTFPVEWLHQWMRLPMYAGDTTKTWIDTVRVAERQVGVRAWIYTEGHDLAALVVWLRWAKILEPSPRTVPIPEWFYLNRNR